jgi:hypothetical protein
MKNKSKNTNGSFNFNISGNNNDNSNNTNNCNSNIEGFSFILYATLVTFVIANNLEPAEQEMLGDFLQIVGANLSIIASFNEENSENPIII